jgi:hypothetical protein
VSCVCVFCVWMLTGTAKLWQPMSCRTLCLCVFCVCSVSALYVCVGAVQSALCQHFVLVTLGTGLGGEESRRQGQGDVNRWERSPCLTVRSASLSAVFVVRPAGTCSHTLYLRACLIPAAGDSCVSSWRPCLLGQPPWCDSVDWVGRSNNGIVDPSMMTWGGGDGGTGHGAAACLAYLPPAARGSTAMLNHPVSSSTVNKVNKPAAAQLQGCCCSLWHMGNSLSTAWGCVALGTGGHNGQDGGWGATEGRGG